MAGGAAATDGRATTTVGHPVRRVEDRALLTGAAEFVDDLRPRDVLHARYVRSPVAHGRLGAVRLDDARSAPGVVGAFAAGDLDIGPLSMPIRNDAAFSPDRPLLAADRVRFVGEPLAVVVADTPYAAEDAAALVEAEIESFDAIVDPLAAPDAAPLHDEAGSNVIYDAIEEFGEVEEAFAGAAAVVERTFRNPRYAAAPMEPRGVTAAPDGDGLRMWASTQAPHKLAEITADLLGLEIDRVRVSTADVGGGFGQKAHAYPEEMLVAWLARKLGRAVAWNEDRAENLIAASHARDQVVRVRAAADSDGRLLAVDADVVCDVGAYGVYPHAHLLEPLGTPAMIPGPYRLRTYRARARAVTTNKCPEGAYRGVGLPVSAFVHERLMDLVAGELGLDRAEVRRRNLVGADEMPYVSTTHHRYDSGDHPAALERALEAVRYDGFAEERRRARDEGRLLGLGVSCYVEYSGMGSAVFHGRGMVAVHGHDRAWIRLDGEGRATVWTTLPAIGQGVATTFAQLAAADLGLGLDKVRVERSDTGAGRGDGTGTYASRSAVAGGGAIAAAAAELRRRLLDDAAEELEAAAADLELVDGRLQVRGSPSRAVPVGALVARNPERYSTDGFFDPPRTAYPYATHACVVEVEPETGDVRILRYVVVEDCGTVINPIIVEGQVHGATAQGIGGALLEAVHYDADGQPLTGSFMDYLLPTAVEMPDMEVGHLEIPSPDSPNGAKGVGEGGTLAPPGAIANAVGDALDAEFNELPLLPERVEEAARRALASAQM